MSNESNQRPSKEQEIKKLKDYGDKLRNNPPTLGTSEPIGNINRSSKDG